MLSERNMELKDSLELKDGFFKTRHGEKKELVNLRQKYALELMMARDKISVKRHKERLEVLDSKFNGYVKE